MSTPDTRDPSTFPMADYGRLLRPAAMPRFDELAERLPDEVADLYPLVGLVQHRLSTLPMVKSIGVKVGSQLRDGSTAKAVFDCEVVVEDKVYHVALIIRSDVSGQNGLCCITSSADPTPLCTVRFDPFIDQCITVLEQVLGPNS